ncbi:hypothetical protein CgunFtcFv8_018344 [Champsocephalus gunnari]|uniref:RCC1-like domain-containing protein n=1 Tax=Champsocephalus gunnari TaxID=52237 RepID=A0AAN8GTQ7_CHAGU|nr:hypothetical protein CgunFtcFv8_018344 [Champsocephalus gunnari]
MAGETQDEIPESGAVFTFGKSKFAENVPSKFWLKNDVPLKIACGDEHTALITEHGKLFMFGSNNWGQLGLGSKATVSKPTCVKALKCERVQTVACGRNHTLLCTAQGAVFSSGGNSEGQLGLGDCEERTSFQRIAFFDSRGPIRMLAAGSNTSAALTEGGDLFMWGDNTEGQIGLGKEGHAATPQEVSVGRSVSWVSCGYYHSAFITEDGGLYTFGECDSGKLGLNTEQLQRHRVPQLVGGLRQPVTQVSCGGGAHRGSHRGRRVHRGRVCHVTCGENHTAVITDGGLLYTFGDGRHGKLGLGDENFTNQFKPTLCPRFLKYDVQAVTCGGCHMVALARPQGPERLRDSGGGGRDGGLPAEALRGAAGGLHGLLHPPEEPLCSGAQEGEGEISGALRLHVHARLPAASAPRLQPHSQQQTDELVENLTDTDSVKGLGETSDFLNMTHVMKTDAGDTSLTLSPVQKLTGKSSKDQIKKSPFSSRESNAASPRRALPTELLRNPGTTLSQNKENLVLAMEELQRPGKNKSMADIRKAASRQRVRPTPGGSTLMEVARKSQREVKAVQSKPIAVQSVSSPHTLRLNEEESLSEVRSKDLSKKSKNEKNQKEAEVGEGTPEKASQLGLVAGAASVAALLALQVASLSESGLPREERTEDYSNKSAVSINIIPQSPEGSKETSQEEEEEESRSAEVSEKEQEEEVSHSVEKVTEDDDEDEEDDEDEGEEVSHSVEKVTEDDDEDDDEDEGEEVSHSVEKVTEDDEDDEDEGEEVSHSVEKVTEDEDEEDEGEEVSHSVEKVTEDDEDEGEEVSHSVEKVTEDEDDEDEEDEGEEVSHSVEKVTEDDEDEEEDCNTLQTEDDEDEDKSSAEEEEEASGTAGSESEDETESKESRGSDEDEEEEGSSNETESAGRSSESEEGEGSEEEERKRREKEVMKKVRQREERKRREKQVMKEVRQREERKRREKEVMKKVRQREKRKRREKEVRKKGEEEGEGSEEGEEGEGSEKEGEEEGEGSETEREEEGDGSDEGSETEGGEEEEGEGSETEGGEEGEGSETEGGEEGEGSDEGSETEGGEEEEGEGSETEGGEERGRDEGSETEGGEEEEGEGSETEGGEEEEGEGSETEGGEEEEGEGSETEGGEEEEGEGSDEGSETEGGEEEEGEKDEKEEEEEEEEEVVQKTKSAGVQRGKARSRQRSGVKGQAAGEEEEFWDDVLPQYLNLK